MPFDCDAVIGKITRSLMSSPGLNATSVGPSPGRGTAETMRGIAASRVVGSIVTLPSLLIVPARKVSDETWPSPTARRLRTKRSPPLGASDWSGWATMLGLKRAEASKEYSERKYAPTSWR